MNTLAVYLTFPEACTSEHFGGKFPRIQILTVAEIFAGKKVEFPAAAQTNVTFRKAPKAKTEGETPSLF